MMNYVAEVAACILSHCSKEKLLGAEVYAAIAEWEKNGVPSELVRASIDQAFLETDGLHNGNLPVALIMDVVMSNFKSWLVRGS
ncbi:MAG: hypothetical protein WBD16_15675 [Pyrinomonadaceae bacterium]